MNPVFNQDFFAGKQLLIFGAGYVGAAVAQSFLDSGGGVTALTRNASKAARLRSQGIATIEGDLSARDWHDQVVARSDFVLNCVSSGGGGVAGLPTVLPRRSQIDSRLGFAHRPDRPFDLYRKHVGVCAGRGAGGG